MNWVSRTNDPQTVGEPCLLCHFISTSYSVSGTFLYVFVIIIIIAIISREWPEQSIPDGAYTTFK